jgi:hypothetical protein
MGFYDEDTLYTWKSMAGVIPEIGMCVEDERYNLRGVIVEVAQDRVKIELQYGYIEISRKDLNHYTLRIVVDGEVEPTRH